MEYSWLMGLWPLRQALFPSVLEHGECAMTSAESGEHTPGPWRIIKGDADDHDRWVISSGLYVAGASCVADARLIAAAPDLLAALQAMVTWMPSGFAPHSKANAMGMANAAIAKAIGTTSKY
jgi:hypothetical protein